VDVFIDGARVTAPIESISWEAKGNEAACATIKFVGVEVEIETVITP